MREEGTSSFWSWERIAQIWLYYFDPSLSTKNQLLSGSKAQELVGFTGQVGRMTWEPSPSLLLLMICCCAVQKPLHYETIVKGKEEKREKERKREESRKYEEWKVWEDMRKGRRKEQLKTWLPLDIFRRFWYLYISVLLYIENDWKLKINISSETHFTSLFQHLHCYNSFPGIN